MTTVTTMAAVVLAASAWFGCGSEPAKPPLTPDGPEMTAPIGDDGGAAMANPPTSAVEEPMSPPAGKAGGSESQTTIGH